MLTMGHRWLTVIRGAKPYETKYSEVAGNGTSEAMAHFQPLLPTIYIYIYICVILNLLARCKTCCKQANKSGSQAQNNVAYQNHKYKKKHVPAMVICIAL